MHALRRCFAVSLLLAPGASDAQQLTQAAKRSDFALFCKDFAESYAYRDRPERPWLTWSARFAAQVDAAPDKAAIAAVFEAALDELHDFHAEVRSRNPHRWLPVPTFADLWAETRGAEVVVTAVRGGSDAERAGIVPGDQVMAIDDVPIDVAIRARLTDAVPETPAARQWALLSVLTGRSDQARRLTIRHSAATPTRTIELPQERRFDRPPGPLTATVLPGDLGIIRFINSLGDQATVPAFDQALVALRSTRGLVLDLRDVPSGGDSSVALGILGRFMTRLEPYQRHRIPHYGQADVERNWFELVAPRGPFPYTAPLVVLVDHWTGSMGEGIAIGFDAMARSAGRTIVVGTPMAQLAGAVDDLRLPETGIDVAFATEQILTVSGTPRQQWLPPILVDETPATRPGDAALERAESLLREQIKRGRLVSRH